MNLIVSGIAKQVFAGITTDLGGVMNSVKGFFEDLGETIGGWFKIDGAALPAARSAT